MNNHLTIEVHRLALSFVATRDPDDNMRSFKASMKAVADDGERTTMLFNALRFLAGKIHESASAAGQLDHVVAQVNLALSELLLEDQS